MNKHLHLPKELVSMLEGAGFTIAFDKDDDTLEFRKYSPAGQDFRFYVKHEDEKQLGWLRDNIFIKWQDYDPSYEASLWLDESGHGKNGAPYDMRDVYEDMGFEVVTGFLGCNITQTIKAIGEDRDGLPYWIDGAVVKVDSLSLRKEG